MARVPEYFRGPLASERTGTPGIDLSGAQIAQSVEGMANTFFRAAEVLAKEQKRYQDQSTVVKGTGDFMIGLAENSDRIRQEHAMDPDQAVMKSSEAYNDLKQRQLSGINDGPLRQQMAAQFDQVLTQQRVKDTTWKLQQQRLVTQKNYADTLNTGAESLGSEGATYAKYWDAVKKWSDKRTDFGQVFGLDKMDGMVEMGREAYTRAFVNGKISNGQSLEAKALLEGGKFDPFITDKTKTELSATIDKAYKGEIQKSKFTAFSQAAAENYDLAKQYSAGELDIFMVEEKISQTSFEEAQARQSNAPEEVIQAKQKQREFLLQLRDLRLEEIATQVSEDDLDTSTVLWGAFNQLVSRQTVEGQTTVNMLGNLDQLLDFQQQATRAHYEKKITKATYDRWMSFSKAAAYNNVSDENAFNKGWFGATQSTPNVSKEYAAALKDIAGDVGGLDPLTQTEVDPVWALDAFNFYVDEIQDRSMGDVENFQANKETMNQILHRAKAKASLKKAGLPVYLNVGDSIKTFAGHYTLKGFGPRDEILVEVPQEDFK